MKNNKYQITGIKGRLLHLGFVTCYLLIVLLYACDGGYQPKVTGIKFFYKDSKTDTVKKPVDGNLFIDTKGTVYLGISCVKPSSVSDNDISITLSLDKEFLGINSTNIEDDFKDDKENIVIPQSDDDSGSYIIYKIVFKKMSDIFPVTIAAKDQTGYAGIEVTVEPGGLTFTCPVTVATYIVTFDKNGGETEADPRQKAIFNEDDPIDALPTPPEHSDITKAFDSWNTKADGTGTPFDENTPVTDSIIVYAQWN